ncbi:MAG: hypothetical protein NC311_15215 [Muribaculaceae bacterium]|nr:hypothetical protein [Muribaculaceae bacterium]
MPARFEDGCHACANTSALIAKVLAGKGTLEYTRAAIGSGIIGEGQSPKTLTEPPGYVMDGVIASVGNPFEGEVQIQVQVASSMVDTSFKATGVMLYARDPETGEDVPYTYLCLETESEEIRSRSNAVGKIAVFDIIAVVGDVKNVTAVIDPNAMATHASVEAMLAQRLNRRAITIPTDGWVLEEDAPAVISPIMPLAEGDESEIAGEVQRIMYCLDIRIEDINENCMPDLMIDRGQSALQAAACGLAPVCESMDGALRVYAANPPEVSMTGTLGLVELTRRS